MIFMSSKISRCIFDALILQTNSFPANVKLLSYSACMYGRFALKSMQNLCRKRWFVKLFDIHTHLIIRNEGTKEADSGIVYKY